MGDLRDRIKDSSLYENWGPRGYRWWRLWFLMMHVPALALVVAYVRRNGPIHTGPYGVDGRYIVMMTDAEYHRHVHAIADGGT